MLITEPTPTPTPTVLGQRIVDWLDGRCHADPARLRELVKGQHDLDGYVGRIVGELQSLVEEVGMRRGRQS